MAKSRGDLLITDKGKLVGKQQLYALLTDASGNAILDAEGNEQLIEIQADANGKIKTLTEINGSLTNIRMITLSQSATIAAGGSETVQITAASNKEARIIGLFLNVPAVAGATSGNQNVEWAVNLLGMGAWATATYSGTLKWSYGAWSGHSSSIPSDVNLQNRLLSNVRFSDTIPFLMKFANLTNADQTTSRTIQVLIEERSYK